MDQWEQFKNGLYYSDKEHLLIDWSGMGLCDKIIEQMEDKVSDALDFMEKLEAGAIANPTEGRMVGHYWLRDPDLAPTEEIRNEIKENIRKVSEFAEKIHSEQITNSAGRAFKNVIVAGVGGSNLGVEFVYRTLPYRDRKMKLYFLNNTDPDGVDNVFTAVKNNLDATIIIVISKSGGTVETRNCMEEARMFFESNGISFPSHAVSISERGSMLDKVSEEEGWLGRFHMWNWVGGRTSVMSAVGLLPLALAGVETDSLLRGAAGCDKLTRLRGGIRNNPAALMAVLWYACSGGQCGETMVILPYKDALGLLTKYLQQLIMESLGKEFDINGNTVNQGFAVMGNKGTSDQHSYVQQLVSSPKDVFVTFVQALKDREGFSSLIGDNSTSGDFLNAFMLGTKKALESHGCQTMTITVPDASAYHVGKLIALYERAVGIYAQLINVNAYDQPAVEYGKKACVGLIDLKNEAKKLLDSNNYQYMSAVEIAEKLNAEPGDIFRMMVHFVANHPRAFMELKDPIWESKFMMVKRTDQERK